MSGCYCWGDSIAMMKEHAGQDVAGLWLQCFFKSAGHIQPQNMNDSPFSKLVQDLNILVQTATYDGSQLPPFSSLSLRYFLVPYIYPFRSPHYLLIPHSPLIPE